MKTKYYGLFYCLLLSIAIHLIPKTGITQTPAEECKTFKRANRNKVWQFESYTVLESEYNIDGLVCRIVPAGAEDSVFLYAWDRSLIKSFLSDRHGHILTPLNLNYVENGYTLTDSIVPGSRGKLHRYFYGILYSDAVRLTENRLGETKMYYDKAGKDSLWIVHSGGKLQLRTWYRNGKDSLQRRWNYSGQLIYEKTKDTEQEWDADQKLMQKTFDTLIQDETVKCRKIWHPTGALASITYHYFDQPCLTWKYYNEQGKLIKQIRHEDLDKVSPVVTVMHPEVMYTTIDQMEEVLPIFKHELNRKLAEMLCWTKLKPEGVYHMQVWLDPKGKLVLKSLQGAHAEALQPDMEAIFKQLSWAKPPKRNGIPYARLLQVNLVVKSKGKK